MEYEGKRSSILGVGGSQETFGIILANICSKSGCSLGFQSEFSVVAKIMEPTPSISLRLHTHGLIADSDLADNNFAVPGPVDVLLGSGVCAQIFMENIKKLDSGIIALQTSLGWVIFGECIEPRTFPCQILDSTEDAGLDAALKRIWEADQVESPKLEMTPDEVWCEKYFEETCQRSQDGRYVTYLSMKPNEIELGESYEQALHRFYSLEKRLKRDPELAKLYIDFMREYEQLGHMREALRTISHERQHYYIPHHPVLKKISRCF